MPWASVATGFGSANVAGTEGDGKGTLFIGLAIIVIGLVTLTSGRRFAVIQLLASPSAGAVAVDDISNVSGRVASISSAYIHASVGSGLYVVLAGAAAAIVGGFLTSDTSGKSHGLMPRFLMPHNGEEPEAGNNPTRPDRDS